MGFKDDYIKEHTASVKALATRYSLKNYPPGSKIDETEKDKFFKEFFEQYNQLEKAIAEKEETIIHEAIQDGQTDVLELERELAFISRRQLEDYRSMYKPY